MLIVMKATQPYKKQFDSVVDAIEEFPFQDEDVLASVDYINHIVTIHCPEYDALEDEQEAFLGQGSNLFTYTIIQDDAPHGEPQADVHVLHENEHQRTVMLEERYDYSLSDTLAIMRTDGSCMFAQRSLMNPTHIGLDYKAVKRFIAAWQVWEQEHPDMAIDAEHPF